MKVAQQGGIGELTLDGHDAAAAVVHYIEDFEPVSSCAFLLTANIPEVGIYKRKQEVNKKKEG